MDKSLKTIEFVKCREVNSPNMAHIGDAGSDIYIPEYSPLFLASLIRKNSDRNIKYRMDQVDAQKVVLFITIAPQERILIPSGIRVNIKDQNTYLHVENKSGIADKYGLIFGSDIIDPSYRGEIHISLINTSDKPVTIFTGMKICQLIQHVYIDTDWKEISAAEFANLEKTDRNEDGFGSTGIN